MSRWAWRGMFEPRGQRFADLGLFLLCLAPHGFRLAYPSLYADDVVRVEQLQTLPTLDLLFLPFNEHMAPLFQGVSWLVWRLIGGSLAWAGVAFTWVSFLPVIPALGLLAAILRRETGSGLVARCGVACLAISWVAAETVNWYSASSFLWALVATELAWWGTLRALGDRESPRGRAVGFLLAALGTAAAPAFSAIGLLAGPLVVSRLLGATPEVQARRRLLVALAAALGLGGYFAVCAGFRYQAVLAASVERQVRLLPALEATLRAPVEVLVPALFGWKPPAASGSLVVLGMGCTVIAALGIAVAAWARPRDRALLMCGFLLVFGGYALAFAARANGQVDVVLQTQRYHLFPLLGLVTVLAVVARPLLAPLDTTPLAQVVPQMLALVLLVTHAGEMRGRARFLRHPDQASTLATIDRLGASCARLGISRGQALRALDPIETEWTPVGHSALVMLPASADGSRVADSEVRAMLLSALDPADRLAICGGMDATPYLSGTLDPDPSAPLAVGRVVKRFRVAESTDGGLRAEGWPAFVEYAFEGPDPAGAGSLEIPAAIPSGRVELWWRGPQDRWSETRSARLEPSHLGKEGVLRLPLRRLPHWDAAHAARLRILFHEPGRVASTPPRLLR